MKKYVVVFILVCCLLLSASCKGPGSPVKPSRVSAGSQQTDIAATETSSDEYPTESGYVTVKAAADEPVALVSSMGKDGYINTKGEWVIAPQYMLAYSFVDNVATVQTFDKQWLLINKDNEVIAKFDMGIEVIAPIIPEVYWSMSMSNLGVGKAGCTIFDGMIIIGKDNNGDGIVTEGDDLFGYADTTGKIVVEPKYTDACAFGDGLAGVNTGTGSYENTWEFIDKTGAVVIEPKYDFIGVFSDGLCNVSISGQPGETGYIDKQGNFVTTSNNYIYTSGIFNEGFAPVGIKHKFGVIDKTGKVLGTVPGSDDPHTTGGRSPISILGGSFNEGLYPLFDISLPQTDDGFWPQGFIDTTGQFVIPAQTEWKVWQGFSEDLCCVYKGKYVTSMDLTFGYIDKTGKVVIPIQYSAATMFRFGYAIVATGSMGDSHFSIIDKSGKTVAELTDVSGAAPFTK